MKHTRTNVHRIRRKTRMSQKPREENLTIRGELCKIIEHSRNNKAWSMPIKFGNKEGPGNFGGEFRWSVEGRSYISVE